MVLFGWCTVCTVQAAERTTVQIDEQLSQCTVYQLRKDRVCSFLPATPCSTADSAVVSSCCLSAISRGCTTSSTASRCTSSGHQDCNNFCSNAIRTAAGLHNADSTQNRKHQSSNGDGGVFSATWIAQLFSTAASVCAAAPESTPAAQHSTSAAGTTSSFVQLGQSVQCLARAW